MLHEIALFLLSLAKAILVGCFIAGCRIGSQRIEIRFDGLSKTLEREAARFWHVELAVSGRLKREPRGSKDALFWELGVSDPLEALRCCREGRRILFSSEHESPELARQCYQESAVVSSWRETKDACQLGYNRSKS